MARQQQQLKVQAKQGAFCVEQVVDSSRFFAVRVVDGPRKAILGIGFEDRSDAFDFGVALQEVRRHMDAQKNAAASATSGQAPNGHGAEDGGAAAGLARVGVAVEKKDYSLKEGETISIDRKSTRLNSSHRP